MIGPGHERLDDYGRDESPLPEFFPPLCAVLVESTAQAAAVLRICAERKVPVTPRGAGSGMCGGALPIAGVRVVVDEMSLMYLVGTEIDYVEGLQGAGFKFNNPNVKSTCGCGSSFSV